MGKNSKYTSKCFSVVSVCLFLCKNAHEKNANLYSDNERKLKQELHSF